MSEPRPPSGMYLLLLALTGASAGIATMETLRAVTAAATGDWWGHALTALTFGFLGAYVFLMARERREAELKTDLPEPVDPNARDSRAYSR